MGIQLLPQEVTERKPRVTAPKPASQSADNVVIRIDWEAIRRKVVMQRQQEAGGD